MTHIFVNGLSASAGGGLTYLRNVVPHLNERVKGTATVLLPTALREQFEQYDNVELSFGPDSGNALRRFLWEQREIPRLIREAKADVLLSAGNFALFKSPVPQILLSRNSLYTSRDFYRDLAQRHDYRLWLDTRVKSAFAKHSVRLADVTVAPSASFADELAHWTGKKAVTIHHGFDAELFEANREGLPGAIQRKLEVPKETLKLLFVSHYNYYRNFETLFRALPIIEKQLTGRGVRLFVTCTLGSAAEPGSYRADAAIKVIRRLGLEEKVIELGSVPYSLLHHVYRSADVYVTAAYAETFAHPLVEAMSCGLPVVASDLPVHRETCAEAALYFPAFSSEVLADLVCDVARSTTRREQMSAAGMQRAKLFSWKKHVQQIFELAATLTARDQTQGR